MSETEDTLKLLKQEAFSGGLAKASTETLEKYAAIICHPQAFSLFGTHEFPQISETVRIHLLRAHIASLQSHVVNLHDHITKLNKSNSKLQKWVIALAAAALFSAAVQTIISVRSEWRTTELIKTNSQQQAPLETSLVKPTPLAPQSSHPPIEKKP